MIRPVITTVDPDAHRLREQARTVGKGVDVTGLVRDLRDTLRHHGAVGLAAPQIGVPLRVCVVEYGGVSVALVNPEIRVFRGEDGREAKGPQRIAALEEGCLSLPGYSAHIARPPAITVTYKTPRGAKVRQTFTGMLARAICHEVDHLQAVLLHDRVWAQNRVRQAQGEGAQTPVTHAPVGNGGVAKALVVDDLLPAATAAAVA